MINNREKSKEIESSTKLKTRPKSASVHNICN